MVNSPPSKQNPPSSTADSTLSSPRSSPPLSVFSTVSVARSDADVHGTALDARVTVLTSPGRAQAVNIRVATDLGSLAQAGPSAAAATMSNGSNDSAASIVASRSRYRNPASRGPVAGSSTDANVVVIQTTGTDRPGPVLPNDTVAAPSVDDGAVARALNASVAEVPSRYRR